MSLGLQPAKLDVDQLSGQLTRDITNLLRQAAAFNTWLIAQNDAALTALGYTTVDIANLRGAFNDLNTLSTVFTGAATVQVAYDFRSYCRWVYGLGTAQ
jgi:hypothetical protein